MSVTDATRSGLVEARRIAIHYPDWSDGFRDVDVLSADPADHDARGARVLRRFRRLAEEGGYVCAEYHGLDPCLVGFVPPGTAVELSEGEWRDIPNRTAILKTIRLERSRFIPKSSSAAILAGRPRQGSFMRWSKVGRAIERLVEGTVGPPTLDDLSPAQQEVLCGEFLRSEAASALGLPRLAHLVLPIGRTLRDLDLIGIAADGLHLYAQVTHAQACDVGWKINRLRPFVDRGHCLLFAQASEIRREEGIVTVPLALAFQYLANEPHGARWLAMAIGDAGDQPPSTTV